MAPSKLRAFAIAGAVIVSASTLSLAAPKGDAEGVAKRIAPVAAWAPRLKLGLDGLVKSAITGKNAMPPKGGSDANEIEMARVVAFMANKSGASFKEPAAK